MTVKSVKSTHSQDLNRDRSWLLGGHSHLLFLPPRPTPSRPGQCGASNDGTEGKMMRNRGSLDDFGRSPEFSRPQCKINQYCHFEDLDCRLRWQMMAGSLVCSDENPHNRLCFRRSCWAQIRVKQWDSQ